MKAAFPTVRLSEIAQLNPTLGGRLPQDELVSFVPMASMSAETARVETTQDRPYFEVSKGFTPFLSGDVLIAKITPCFENGKIAQANLPRRNGFGSTEFHVVRSRPDLSDARYLHHYLRLKDVRTEGQRRMTGSGGQRRVPANFLSELRIPAPPLSEQRRIAAILDQAETLRTQRRAALAQLDSLTQSLFLDMFGNATKFDLKPIQAVLDLSKKKKSNASNSDVWLLNLDQIESHTGRVLSKIRVNTSSIGNSTFNFEPDTVLYSKLRPYLNKVVVTDEAGFATTELVELRCDKSLILTSYLGHFLRMPEFLQFATAVVSGAKMPRMVMSEFWNYPVPIPPISLQQTFSTRIQAIESLKTTHRTALTELDALFASLQQRAFAGEL